MMIGKRRREIDLVVAGVELGVGRVYGAKTSQASGLLLLRMMHGVSKWYSMFCHH